MATGQILFHRYFYTKSFVKNNMEVRAITQHAQLVILLSLILVLRNGSNLFK